LQKKTVYRTSEASPGLLTEEDLVPYARSFLWWHTREDRVSYTVSYPHTLPRKTEEPYFISFPW
jgi:hypothetical protein